MALHLRREGVCIGRRRAVRLMTPDGAAGNLSGAAHHAAPHAEHRVWPYLLRGLAIERPNHVWQPPISPTSRCSVASFISWRCMDWASRHVPGLASSSNDADAGFCTDALEEALSPAWQAVRSSTPTRAARFTSFAFTGRLQRGSASGSRWMAGAGAWTISSSSNLWRSLKYDCDLPP